MFGLKNVTCSCKLIVLKVIITALSTLIISSCGSSDGTGSQGNPTKTSVGKALFFDENLSSNKNQSCATCHAPNHGFADPRVSDVAPVSEGSVSGHFGHRNAPTAAYASFIPVFKSNTTTTKDGTVSNFEGGQFIDGRRDSLKEQAKDPFLNPVEMNNANKLAVVNEVKNAQYADSFKLIYGAKVFDDIDTAYENIADAIAAFETSPALNRFNSKFDFVMRGAATFTDSEQRGFDLFKSDVAKCSECHTVKAADEKSLFTDFRYFNVGTPINPNNPSGNTSPDQGLGSADRMPVVSNSANEAGKFRTPTLRNVALTAPYMHNGVYKTLQEVIRHYDITVSHYEEGFSPISEKPEVISNIAKEMKLGELTGLGLTEQNYTDLENFMKILSDGYKH